MNAPVETRQVGYVLFGKDASTEIRVELLRWDDNPAQVVSIRRFTFDPADGKYHATKSGVVFQQHHLPMIIRFLQEAQGSLTTSAEPASVALFQKEQGR